MSEVKSMLSGDTLTIDEKTAAADIYLLKYFLLYEKKDGRDCFSVRVVQSREGEDICQAMAYDITDRRDFAVEVFTRIWQGVVFPVTLCDVVYNLLP